MLGHDVSLQREKPAVKRGEARLTVTGLEVRGDRGLPAVRGASLKVHGGEILGIAGVAGNGQRELAEAIAGLRRTTAGTVAIGGRLAFIPEDRLGMGLVPNLDVCDNAILRAYRRAPVAQGGLLSRKGLRDFAYSLTRRFDVRAAGLGVPVKLLSGGNQQKLLVGRELAEDPSVIVASQPVRGLDVAATEAVHSLLLKARQDGTAILLISEDLDELMSLSDRIAVLFEGRIMGVVDAKPEHRDAIGLMMAGRQPSAEEVPA